MIGQDRWCYGWRIINLHGPFLPPASEAPFRLQGREARGVSYMLAIFFLAACQIIRPGLFMIGQKSHWPAQHRVRTRLPVVIGWALQPVATDPRKNLSAPGVPLVGVSLLYDGKNPAEEK
jgi:hypothetical protein